MNNSDNGYPTFNITEIEEAEEQAERDREEAKRVAPIIEQAITYLEHARGREREVIERLGDKPAGAKNFLETQLKHPVPAVRRAVWRAVLGFELGRAIDSREEVEALLSNLVKRNLLQEVAGGYLYAYGRSYQVLPESYFGPPEKAEVKQLLHDLLGAVKAKLLAGLTRLTLEQLFGGKPGNYIMEVPPEKTSNGKWLSGGVLRVASNGDYITPLEAMGGIESAIEKAKDLGARLQVKSLKESKPPFFPRGDPDFGAKVRFLWHIIRRAKRLEDERVAFPERATVTPEEFFLEGKTGVCLVDLGQIVWEEADQQGKVKNRHYSVFFLVRRFETEGIKRLSIVEVPDHLVDLLAPCMGEYEEGEKFQGCPWPLLGILREGRRQCLKALQNAKKAGEIAAEAITEVLNEVR